jgi:hypothetical protein
LFYLLFIFYCILFCWLITRIKFFTQSGLSHQILIVLFLLRIVASLIGSYFNLYYYPFSDSLGFHNEGIIENHLLFSNPHEYFTNIFQDTYHNNYSGLLDTTNSFWNNTKSVVIVKLLSIFDIFSGKNFFINTLFYNFFVFFGAVALYKVFITIFPDSSYPLIACIFILPSALFFTAMIHRDGLTLLSLSIVIYNLFFMMNYHQFSWKRILIITIFLILIFLVRNFVFIALVPACIAWIIAQYKPKFAFISFISVYIIVATLFFSLGLISAKTDLPRYVSERQTAFVEISKSGASNLKINPLFPNFKSFLNNAPQALNHSLIRPYVTEIESFVYIPFALEIILYEVVFLLFIFFRKKDFIINPIIYFCIFFSLTMFLIIGYTVPIIGAIVRYRSIFFTFLILPIFCYFDWQKLKMILHKK